MEDAVDIYRYAVGILHNFEALDDGNVNIYEEITCNLKMWKINSVLFAI